MTFVGFKRMTIGIYGTDGKITPSDLIVVEGKENEGATVSAEISGLSKEPTKVYGSNIAYYISQKGTGDVSVNFGILDLPDGANDKILGYKTNENKISFLGEDTEPPFCAVMLESEDLNSETAVLSIFKGKFSRDAINLNTTTDEAFEPEAEEYTFSAISSDAAGDTNGQIVGKYVGKDTAAIEQMKKLTFPSGE